MLDLLLNPCSITTNFGPSTMMPRIQLCAVKVLYVHYKYPKDSMQCSVEGFSNARNTFESPLSGGRVLPAKVWR